MRGAVVRAGLVLAALVVPCAAWIAGAGARPGSGPRETVNQRFTTQRPGTPAGLRFAGHFHAADDPKGTPPYLRRMVVHPPRGMRYDTSVPGRCTASDAQLAALGPAACPPDSHIGHGRAEGLFQEPVGHDFLIDHFRHHTDIFNNTDEQIVLVESEGSTVVRGRLRPDGSMVFATPTCFPHPPAGGCADEYIVQLVTSSTIPRYVRTVKRHTRSYATTPPSCPARGYWKTVVVLSWSDGKRDKVATAQPCVP